MIADYDFLCGNDFTLVKIALSNDDYHTIRVQAELAKTIDFSGGLRNINQIIIDRCTQFSLIDWPENSRKIRCLKIGNSANLSHLDLSRLVNLEELTIINCKNLAKIKGLGEHLKKINIQGCKLDSLELSRCKKMNTFILSTQETNLTLNFKHNTSLHSVVIDVDAVKVQKTEDTYRDNSGRLECVLNHCVNLNTLMFHALDIPAKIDISGCSSLKNGLFVLDDGAHITGASTCTQLETTQDFDSHLIKIEDYLNKNKKNALRLPANPNDIETIIQQNGICKKRNKSCLVKLQLLMNPGSSSYTYSYNKYEMQQCKVAWVNKDSPRSSSPFKNASVVMQQHSKGWSTDFQNSLIENSEFKYKTQQAFINQPDLWDQYFLGNENKYKKLNLPKRYVLPIPKKHVVVNPVNFAIGIFSEELVTSKYDVALNFNKTLSVVNHSLIRNNDLIKGPLINNFYYPIASPKKLNITSNFKINDLKFNPYDEAKKTEKKDVFSLPPELSGAEKMEAEAARLSDFPFLTPEQNNTFDLSVLEIKKKQNPNYDLTPLIVPAVFAGYDSESNNLSAYAIDTKCVSQEKLQNVGKQKVDARTLIQELSLADYEHDETALCTLELSQKSAPVINLSSAEKEKNNGQSITTEPLLAGYSNEITSILSLETKKKFELQDGLISVEKIKKNPSPLIAQPVLSGQKNEINSLTTLNINFPHKLTVVKKIIAEPQYLIANAVLVKKDSDILSNQDLHFSHQVVRALVDLKPRNSDLPHDDYPAFFLKQRNEKLNNDLKDIQNNQVIQNVLEAIPNHLNNEDIYYTHQVVRALVDLKPHNPDLLHDDYLFELKDKIDKNLQEIQDNLCSYSDLIAVEKVKIVNHHITAASALASYESVETYLAAINVQGELNESRFNDVALENNQAVFEEENDNRILNDIDALDELDLFDKNLTLSRSEMSADMIELFNTMTDEEKELLFPQGSNPSALYFDALNDSDSYLSFDEAQEPFAFLESEEQLTYEEDSDELFEFDSFSSEEDVFAENIDFIDSKNSETQFEALRELLIECDLLDSVLNDKTGTLLQYMIEKTSALAIDQDDFEEDFSDLEKYEEISVDNALEEIFSEESEEESYAFNDLTSEDDFSFLNEELVLPGIEMSADMIELLNIMTDEEKELLFPKDSKLSAQHFEVLNNIANMPDIEINFKNMNSEHVIKLLQFFDLQEQAGIKSWQKGVIYNFEDGTEFTFKNDVFQRERKTGHQGFRYETISNKKQLGEGGFGIVKRIKGTVSFNAAEEMIHFKKQGKNGKRRVVKIQQHTEDANPLSDYQKGFIFSKRAPHLAIKEPTVVDNNYISQTSYTVMNEISGRELFDIRADDYEGIDVLSTQERIDLTKALLFALKEQVTAQGLVHRDIKPENIMVDLGPPLGVKIIDYDISMDIPDGKFAGTEGYYAPEMVSDPLSVSDKSDVYSMARVIALIWRVDLATYVENADFPYTPDLFTPADTMFGIFDGINDLSDDEKTTIEWALTGMLDTNPDLRFSIDEAIQAFSYLGMGEVTEWNLDNILNWFATADTQALSHTEITAALDLINATSYSVDDSIVYNKERIAPLLKLLEENEEPEIAQQVIRVLFSVPFQWIANEVIQFDSSKPTLFFQMDAKERAEVLKEILNKTANQKILFEALFAPDNNEAFDLANEKNMNELVLDQLFFEKKNSNYSASFFSQNAEVCQLINQKDSEMNQLFCQFLLVEHEQDQEAVKRFLKIKFEEHPDMRWNFGKHFPAYLNDFIQEELNLNLF